MLATGRNVFMARNMGNRVLAMQISAQLGKPLILGIFKGVAFQAFQLDPDRVVIALMTPSVLGNTGMPGPILGTDKLPQHAIATDVEVGGDLQAPNLPEIGVCVPVQPVGEQVLHLVTTVLTRRQTDGVDHHQVDAGILWSGPKIGRFQPDRWQVPALVPKAILFGAPRAHDFFSKSDSTCRGSCGIASGEHPCGQAGLRSCAEVR